VLAVLALAACVPRAGGTPPPEASGRQVPSQAGSASIAALEAEIASARERVVEIVNRPVTHLPRTAEAAVFSPGWFHPGAVTPDFDTVDVRATQEFPYANDDYVTSDVTPSEMFLGREFEFNAMTKIFYTDRTVPKARLSETDMLEINRLYRIIGRDQRALNRRRMTVGLLALVFIAGVALLFVMWRRR
jgi:hypothetical protein